MSSRTVSPGPGPLLKPHVQKLPRAGVGEAVGQGRARRARPKRMGGDRVAGGLAAGLEARGDGDHSGKGDAEGQDEGGAGLQRDAAGRDHCVWVCLERWVVWGQESRDGGSRTKKGLRLFSDCMHNLRGPQTLGPPTLSSRNTVAYFCSRPPPPPPPSSSPPATKWHAVTLHRCTREGSGPNNAEAPLPTARCGGGIACVGRPGRAAAEGGGGGGGGKGSFRARYPGTETGGRQRHAPVPLWRTTAWGPSPSSPASW